MIHNYTTKLVKDADSTLLWDFRTFVPNDIAKTLIDGNRRVLCSFNGLAKIHAALMPDGEGNYFIMINKEIRKKLNLQVGDSLSITLEKDHSKYGMAVPEAFSELCEQDLEGSTFFHSLTKGKQRSLLYVMGKPKSEQKQLEKVLIVFDYLKSVNGKLDFKELNIAFKNSRFKI